MRKNSPWVSAEIPKYATPTLKFRVEHITIPFLSLEYPQHLQNSRLFHLWVTNICPDEETGCWHWMGYTDKDGYGKCCYKVNGGRIDARAHKFGYEKLIGSVPDGLVLDHLCRVRDCVNPWHLEPVEPIVNYRRGNGPSGIAAKINREKTHCPLGHRYEGWNLIVFNSGSRACRKCMYRRIKAQKLKQKGVVKDV